MSSKQEKRAFAEIAEQIAADDPRFAASMRRLQSRRPGHDVVVGLAAASALVCLLLGLAGPCLAAAALAFAAHGLRPHRPARRMPRRRRGRAR